MRVLNTLPLNNKVDVTNNWAIQYDGLMVLAILADHPKMSFSEVLNVIQNEGGYVDESGIVRKGTAENKIAVY